MSITQLVAGELKLTNWTESEPIASINGVTIVEYQADQGNFRVQLVRDSEFLNVKLEEGSKLASYYNSRFWHEIKTAEKLEIPAADFLTAFQIFDVDKKYSAFVTSYPRLEVIKVKDNLELEELEEVAVHLAKLHAVNSQVVSHEFSTAVEENYGNIKAFGREMQKDLLDVLEVSCANDLGRYFLEPQRVMEKVRILVHHRETSHQEQEEGENPHQHQVVTHGRLLAENCRFDDDGKLVEITDWENIHLGNPAEDLTNLIISSADKDLRRKAFMKVFRKYFYTLVDIKPPAFQLTDLKFWFRKQLPFAVIDGIERLLLTVSESSDEAQKYLAAHRWETALDDAVDLLTDNYASDDEQVFFADK